MRELQNVIERMVVRSRNDVIGPDDVPHEVRVTLKTSTPVRERRRTIADELYEQITNENAVVLDRGLPAVSCSGRSPAAPSARWSAAGCRMRAATTRSWRASSTWKATTTSGSSTSCASTLPAVVQGIPMTRTIPFLTVARSLALGPAAAGPVGAQAPQAAVAPSGAAAAGGASRARLRHRARRRAVDPVLAGQGPVRARSDGAARRQGHLPLLNDVQAAGLTPEELGDAIREAARKFVEDPNPTVIVKEIKSRRVFITGRIEKPGPYPLNGKTTILQLIAMAGGLREFVDGKNISLMRSEKDRQSVFAFNYQDVVKKGYIHQNIELKPGDVVVVP